MSALFIVLLKNTKERNSKPVELRSFVSCLKMEHQLILTIRP